MGLSEDIGSGPVGIDTVAFIYFLEEHPRFVPVLEPLFAALAAERLTGVTSLVTLLEVLVVPYRAADLELAERYEILLTRSRGLRMVELDRAHIRAAAHLRARHPRLRTPDALQLAAALGARSTAFVTNDRDLPEFPGLSILQLSRYL